VNRKKLKIDALSVESFATALQPEPVVGGTSDDSSCGSCVSACGMCASVDWSC
jgi:hypothetical protein